MLDTSTPSLARAWDYLLGGGASFAADRALAAQLEALYPGMRGLLFSSRTYAADTIARIARGGVAQYVDLCSGLPTSPAVHEIARAFVPDARVAYVDRDPAVTQHGRALVPGGVRYVAGDLAEPEAILASADLAGFIDFSWPVCLVLTLAVTLLDPGTARAVVGVLVRALPPGSYVVATAAAGEPSLPDTVWPGRFAADDLASFFAGLDLIPPGIQQFQAGDDAALLGAAGRKAANAATGSRAAHAATGSRAVKAAIGTRAADAAGGRMR